MVTTEGYRRGHEDAELSARIREAYSRMGSPSVAVRSSATAEDLFEASMAGQYETYLDVRGEESLLDAVRCCWASLDSPRVTKYLAEHGIDVAGRDGGGRAEARRRPMWPGVLFMRQPAHGLAQEMVVEASWGLGESVVSGRVQPDVLLLDREQGSARGEDRGQAGDGRGGAGEERPVTEERRRVSCLKPDDVAGLLAAWGEGGGELWRAAGRGVGDRGWAVVPAAVAADHDAGAGGGVLRGCCRGHGSG